MCLSPCCLVLQALQEAAKHLGKSRATDREAQVAVLQESCERMSRFAQAQACLAQDPATAVAICQQLLQEAPEHVVSVCVQLSPLFVLPYRTANNAQT